MAMEKVVTPKFRVSFPALFTPKAFSEDQDAKYYVTMLFPEDTDLSEMKALLKAAVNKKWPNKADRPENLKTPFRRGSEKPKLEGYEGCVFVKASSKMRVGVVDQNLQKIICEEDMYAGCYARATVTAYAYDRFGNAGVAFGLQNVQKQADGEEFSGRSKPEDDFDAIDVGPEDLQEEASVKEETSFLD